MVVFVVNRENLKKIKYYIFKKIILLLTVSVVMNMKKCLKKKNQLKYYKFLI